MVVGVLLVLALEGFFDGNGVSLEFSQFCLDLSEWQFGDELIHLHLILVEDGVGVLLPYLLDQVEPSVHAVVL
jgi:hypothetical protein